MALKELKTEDFLGKTVTHRFFQKNRIVGANGTGKTTVKEAICFLFTGTDSAGGRNPQHLISNDKDKCLVNVVTDKAEISRTLTRKGNSTIKLTRNGVSQAMSQSELEATLGSTDLFLSAFVPGYFLSLSTEKQHKIISDITPKIDRLELVRTISGLDVTPEEKIRYNFNRRIDLITNAIAVDRREYDRQVAIKEGEIKQLETLQPLPEPIYPTECDRIPVLLNLKKGWELYEADLRGYNQSAARYERIKLENDMRESKREQLRTLIGLTNVQVVPALNTYDVEIKALNVTRLILPERPAVSAIVDSDNCPHCGQTVGKSHRDHVRETNASLVAEYENNLKLTREHNEGVDKKITKFEAKRYTNRQEIGGIESMNRQTEAKLKACQIELASLVDQELPALADSKPAAPEEVFDGSVLEELTAMRSRNENEVSKYNFVLEQIQAAKSKIEQIQKDIVANQTVRDRLEKLEDGVSKVPQEELKLQMEALKMETVTITVEEEIVIKKDGIRYEFLSTGQRLKADVELCRKLNSLMPRPINMIFLDNADLVDQFNWGDQQMFAAFVDKTVTTINIEEVV